MSTGSTPPPREVTVISKVDIPGQPPDRIGKTDVIVTYQLDPMHVYQIKLPKETATEAAVDAAVRADFKEQLKFIGRKVSV